jgi:hypothetical protein
MIYTCTSTSKGRPTTVAFSSRNLPQFTVTQLSTLGVLGSPNKKQIAYSGYKDNIEAFLYATSMKMKVTIANTSYPVPMDYIPRSSFPYPRTVFGLAKSTNAAEIERMMKGLEGEGIKAIQLGKGGQAYTIDKPSFRTLAVILPSIAKPYISSVDGYSQVEHSLAILRVYQCLDLFLATNTYSYRSNNYQTLVTDTNAGVASVMELRGGMMYYRSGYDKDSKVSKTISADVSKNRKIDDTEVHDLTDHLDSRLHLNHTVLVAKPSPRESSVSYGPPSNVPNSGGLLFPYFPGMLTADAKFIRDVVGRLFLRNFGSTVTDFREAFKIFRANMGIAAATGEGVILSHMLLGASLALDTQTQVFIIFDGDTYLGFCLLGEEFQIFCNGIWHVPLSAEDLRVELKDIATHEGQLEILADRLCRCVNVDGDGLVVSRDMIDTPAKLAEVLQKVDCQEKDKDEEELARILGRLTFRGAFKGTTTDNLVWAIQMLSTKQNEPLPSDMLFHIPVTGWSGITTRVYQVLASFGPTSFSFRNAKGLELTIPKKSDELDPYDVKGDNGKNLREYMLVYLKPVKACVIDWNALADSCQIRVDYNERAAGSRAQRMQGKSMEDIWKALKVAAESGHLGKKREVSHTTDVALAASKKQKIGTGSIGDFF